MRAIINTRTTMDKLILNIGFSVVAASFLVRNDGNYCVRTNWLKVYKIVPLVTFATLTEAPFSSFIGYNCGGYTWGILGAIGGRYLDNIEVAGIGYAIYASFFMKSLNEAARFETLSWLPDISPNFAMGVSAFFGFARFLEANKDVTVEDFAAQTYHITETGLKLIGALFAE